LLLAKRRLEGFKGVSKEFLKRFKLKSKGGLKVVNASVKQDAAESVVCAMPANCLAGQNRC
jgi:hypothetical protein